MRRVVISLAILLAVLGGSSVRAEEPEAAAPSDFDIQDLYRDVRALARRHYPEATAHRLGAKIHFEQDTRIFIVHEPLLTGEWQDPWEERGPRKGGVLCDIEYRTGRYGGQAVVPQDLDKRYFRLLLRAPYSERLDAHLYVHLKLPGIGAPPEGFVEAFEAMLQRFEAYGRK